jgi:epoxyqueuosine reductase
MSEVSEAAAIKAAIRDEALKLGFDAVGFCEAELAGEARRDLERYITAGYHGDMGWLAERSRERASPRALWPEARSVVVLGLSYAPGADPLAALEARETGAISVYAHGRDYHDLVKSRLKRLAGFIAARWPGALKLFVDTAPVMEKPLAERAGIGWQGKHTNLVSREMGSWLFLGEIYLALELPPDAPHEDRCGSCRQCLDACPTNAFPAPHRLDARRCISYLTIEHKGHIAREFRPLIGNRIYGCDDCLAACPWNKFAHEGKLMKSHARGNMASPDLVELLNLDDANFKLFFTGSPILRTKRRGLLRNVCIALGNIGDESALPHLQKAAGDLEPMVAEHARWAMEEIGKRWKRVDDSGNQALTIGNSHTAKFSLK